MCTTWGLVVWIISSNSFFIPLTPIKMCESQTSTGNENSKNVSSDGRLTPKELDNWASHETCVEGFSDPRFSLLR